MKCPLDGEAYGTVGWRVASTPRTELVLDASEQAIYERISNTGKSLVHHSRGVRYVSIKCSERLSEGGIQPSVGSVGDSYDNALAESINGLYKTEVIRKHNPWKNLKAVEFATLKWVDWFNHRRLLQSIGDVLRPNGRQSIIANSKVRHRGLTQTNEFPE